MHIPQDKLQKFQDGAMNTDEMIHFLEHIDQCDFCLEQLLQDEETSSEHAPAYLQDKILKEASLHKLAYCSGYGCCADHAFFCIADRFYSSSYFTGNKS